VFGLLSTRADNNPLEELQLHGGTKQKKPHISVRVMENVNVVMT